MNRIEFPHVKLAKDREACRLLRAKADRESNPERREEVIEELGGVALGYAFSWDDVFEFSPKTRIGIALGSNIGDRLAHLRSGRNQILGIPTLDNLTLCSSAYETEPVGTSPGAGTFINAVIDVGFSGTPTDFLGALQAIEAAHGRPSKRPRNAPRTLDLDILYFGNVVLTGEDIAIPHPRLHLRRFVLTPLNDIRPDLRLPGQSHTVAELLARLDDPAAVTVFAGTW